MSKATPNYVRGAAFIREDEEIDWDWWSRDFQTYEPTNTFRNRVRRLKGIISPEEIKNAVKHGDAYKSANDTVAFINDLDGLVIYVVVTCELQKRDGSYPTDPTEDDYWYGAVTVWPYIYDRGLAWSTGKWSGNDLDKVEEIKKRGMEKDSWQK